MTSMHIDHTITADMPDGQPLPPFIENGVIWHVVCRSDNRTLWRRIALKDDNSRTDSRGSS
jgi:hypothetical protein